MYIILIIIVMTCNDLYFAESTLDVTKPELFVLKLNWVSVELITNLQPINPVTKDMS